MSRGTNPNKIPRTQADVDRAYKRGVDDGLNQGIEMILWVLIDKHDAPMDDIQQLAEELEYVADSIGRGYTTFSMIRKTLKDEYDVEVRLT